jgi:hypothetical protein
MLLVQGWSFTLVMHSNLRTNLFRSCSNNAFSRTWHVCISSHETWDALQMVVDGIDSLWLLCLQRIKKVHCQKVQVVHKGPQGPRSGNLKTYRRGCAESKGCYFFCTESVHVGSRFRQACEELLEFFTALSTSTSACGGFDFNGSFLVRFSPHGSYRNILFYVVVFYPMGILLLLQTILVLFFKGDY